MTTVKDGAPKTRAVPSTPEMKRAAADRYLLRRKRGIEVDGAEAFEAAAMARAETWILEQRVRVRAELRSRKPLRPFDHLEQWVVDGLKMRFARFPALEDQIESAWRAIEENDRSAFDLDRTMPPNALTASDLGAHGAASCASDANHLFSTHAARSQWLTSPPWARLKALLDIAQSLHRLPEPLDQRRLEALANQFRELDLLSGDRNGDAEVMKCIGEAVAARTEWMAKVGRPRHAPRKVHFDVFISKLAERYAAVDDARPLISPDLADVWTFFATEHVQSMKNGVDDLWRHRLDEHAGRDG